MHANNQVTLLADMVDEAVWARHGVGRGGSTVWLERPKEERSNGGGSGSSGGGGGVLIRFRTEMMIDADIFEAVPLHQRCRFAQFVFQPVSRVEYGARLVVGPL
jgi:hypothetical protein